MTIVSLKSDLLKRLTQNYFETLLFYYICESNIILIKSNSFPHDQNNITLLIICRFR
jgi:hypothetical protein